MLAQFRFRELLAEIYSHGCLNPNFQTPSLEDGRHTNAFWEEPRLVVVLDRRAIYPLLTLVAIESLLILECGLYMNIVHVAQCQSKCIIVRAGCCMAIIGYMYFNVRVVLITFACALNLCVESWVGDASCDVAHESTFGRDMACQRVRGVTTYAAKIGRAHV